MNLNDFENHISPEIVGRRYNYFVRECVDDLKKVAPGLWFAEVHGTEIYTVEVRTNRSAVKDWDCDCPYDFVFFGMAYSTATTCLQTGPKSLQYGVVQGAKIFMGKRGMDCSM